jgi:hypothetical protein
VREQQETKNKCKRDSEITTSPWSWIEAGGGKKRRREEKKRRIKYGAVPGQ